MYQINTDKQLDILRWMIYSLDGQWLARTSAVYGPEEASKLNTRVRASFGKLEMKALLALLGKKQAANLSDAAEMLKAYFTLAFGERGFQGQFKPVIASPGGSARLEVEVQKLVALESLKKAAQQAKEDPALACELLWNSWLETLLPEASLQITIRSLPAGELYQIDSLAEIFTSPLPVPTAISTPASTVPEPVSTENEEGLSPIAAALRIPLDQVAPSASTGPAPVSDPYASNSFSFNSPPPPLASDTRPGAVPPIGESEVSGQRPGSGLSRRIRLQSSGSDNSALEPSGLNSYPAETTPAWQPESFAGQPTWESSHPDSTVPPPASLGLDPNTGRPLFSSTPESEAKDALRSYKSRNLPLMSRMFMSKEARELFAKSSEQPVVRPVSIAANVDLILQRKLAQARMAQPGSYPEDIRVVGGMDGGVQIVIGNRTYDSVSDVPAGPIRAILNAAVEEWSESQR
ncbi:MAG TPA: hypothetical protein VH186_25765 [Chloroflexia bacterium]|nr:hypothetical protein [Chloroflexia bacterium]